MKRFIKKLLHILSNVLYIITIIFTITVIFFLIKSKIDGIGLKFGNSRIYIVQSGSMAPTFYTGSVVIVNGINPSEISEGDIISFRDSKDSKRIITHRVVEIKQEPEINYITKGDANDTTDAFPVTPQNVIGKAVFWIPYIGYVASFIRSKVGIAILLIIPGSIFIVYQFINIFRLLKKEKAEKSTREI